MVWDAEKPRKKIIDAEESSKNRGEVYNNMLECDHS